MYRALKIWETGVFADDAKTARKFSEAHLGLRTELGQWAIALKDTIDALADNDWADILNGADHYRKEIFMKQ